MSGLTLSLQSRSRQRRGFSPAMVSQVAAGYFWDPASASASGAGGFIIPEGNGKTAYDMITPSASAAPVIAALGGRAIITCANGSPDRLARTSATKTRGWTGATMIWGWLNCAAAPSIVFGHWRTANNLEIQLTAGSVRLGASDGSVQEALFPLPPGGYAAGPFYIEAIATPNAAHQMWFNRVQQTPTASASLGATLQDTAEFLTFAGTSNDNTTGNISADVSFGVFGITNGVPSSADRDRLFNHRRLG